MLKVFMSDVEVVVAESPEDAGKVLLEAYRLDRSEFIAEFARSPEDGWIEQPLDKPLKIRDEDGPPEAIGWTALQWIEKAGRCLLASTEY